MARVLLYDNVPSARAASTLGSAASALATRTLSREVPRSQPTRYESQCAQEGNPCAYQPLPSSKRRRSVSSRCMAASRCTACSAICSPSALSSASVGFSRMENLYHGDFGTVDLARERRSEEEGRFFGSELGTDERTKEIVNGRR